MITLKRAILSDWPEIAKIEKSSNSNTYSARVLEKEIKDYIKKDFVFLIKNKTVTAGLASFKLLKKKTAHCNGLVIYPKFRRKGFGVKAMSLLLKRMNKYPRVELVVHPHNTSAISLYFSLGFIIEGWRDNYFGDGEPRLMMIKKK